MNYDQVAELLKTLGHPGRIQILVLLAQHGRLNVTTIGDKLNWDLGLLSHHLTKLKDRNLLTCQRVGRDVYYSISDGSLLNLLTIVLGQEDRAEPINKQGQREEGKTTS